MDFLGKTIAWILIGSIALVVLVGVIFGLAILPKIIDDQVIVNVIRFIAVAVGFLFGAGIIRAIMADD